MKKVTYALVSIALCFAGCKPTSIQEKSDSAPIPGIDSARQYLKECIASERVPSLGLFGWSEVGEYWNRVPELKALRDEFEQADEALDNELTKDEEYRQIKKKRYETLFASNIQTLEYIINDYEKQKKEFPVDWIAKASINDKWMPNAKFRDLVERLGRNGFWWDNYWVTEINGRCNEDGKIEYKFKYEHLPPDGRYKWQSCFDTDEELFEKKKAAYAVHAGGSLELVHEQSFTLQNGEKRYQAVWHQPPVHVDGNSGK